MSSFKTFNGYDVEDAYARKSVGELGKIAPGIGIVEGTGVTITDSTEGVVIDLEVDGRSTQKQYSGKNLLDCSGLSTTTSNGVTFTPVYDDNGSLLYVNVNGTATSTASFVLNSNMLFDVESYILNGCPSGGSSSTYKLDVLDTKGSILVVDSGNGISFDVASAFTSQGVRIVVYGGYTVNNLKFYPMLRLASVTDSTYEPYVGGTPSPNPSYPQPIKSVGDMGWFDGELLQGAYSGSSGAWGSTSTCVCNKNIIPCKAGDTIKLEYAEETSQLMILYYDSNKNFISYSSLLSVSELEVNAVENACYFNININNADGITPQTAKHICVTINDKYALIEKSVGKNLLDVNCAEKISSAEQFTVENNIITVKGIGYGVYGVKFSNNNVGLEVGKTYTFSAKSLSGIQLTGYRLGYTDGTYSNTYIGTIGTETIIKEVDYILFYIGTPYTGNTDVLIGDMQIELGNTVTTYEPYIHSRKYIPISAPLRGIGEVTDVASLSECKVDRKLWSDVFDGSNLKCHTVVSLNTVVRATCNLSQKGVPYGTKFCSHLPIVIDYNLDTEHCYTSDVSVHLFINKERLSSTNVEGVNEWLQSNPITVIYELAEPTTETIEYVDIDTFEGVTHISVSDNADCKVSHYRNNEDGKKIRELDNRMVTAEDTINNLESNAVTVAGDIENIKASMSENPLLVTLAPSDELPTIVAGSNVGTFKDTWLNRVINDYEYLIIVVRHRNGSKQIVQIPSMLIEIGGTYTFPFNDVQNNINGAYITINSATRYGIGIFGTLPNDISFELYKYGRPISVG